NDSVEHAIEEQMMVNMRSQQLADALLTLKAAQREVLTLHYLDGMSYAQIAIALGISVAAVRSRMHRGRVRVKERLWEMESRLMGEPDRIRKARIHEVFRASLTGKDPLAIVILKPVDQDVYVPIWVPEVEGQAILMSLRGETTPRPLTHNLMGDLLKSAGVSVERVVVTELRDTVFYGEVRVRGRNGVVDVDARPSDAIALALLTGADLFIGREVIESAGVDDIAPETLRQNPEVEIAPLELPDFDEWVRRSEEGD
ncbi:MAG: bifunctional nuclease domain-containing protein, partial [Anaerolineales bacterium]